MAAECEVIAGAFPKTQDLADKLRSAIPEELKARRQFCIRVGKRPYICNPETNLPDSNWTNQDGWLTFEEALDGLKKGYELKDTDGEVRPVDGIGILAARVEPQIIYGDLDASRDPISGEISPWAREFLEKVGPFYTEISQSGCG